MNVSILAHCENIGHSVLDAASAATAFATLPAIATPTSIDAATATPSGMV